MQRLEFTHHGDWRGRGNPLRKWMQEAIATLEESSADKGNQDEGGRTFILRWLAG
jgi:hypothetical protein